MGLTSAKASVVEEERRKEFEGVRSAEGNSGEVVARERERLGSLGAGVKTDVGLRETQ